MSLRQFLSTQGFADQIEIVGKKDTTNTGNFEVTIGEESKLIHSKKTAGQGRAESVQEREMIVEFIQEYLNDQ